MSELVGLCGYRFNDAGTPLWPGHVRCERQADHEGAHIVYAKALSGTGSSAVHERFLWRDREEAMLSMLRERPEAYVAPPECLAASDALAVSVRELLKQHGAHPVGLCSVCEMALAALRDHRQMKEVTEAAK